MPPILHLLTGCTAVGKTEVALRWAEANWAEIVSCDSLLFYRGMDIGTAKPAPAELARVPHHLIDIREANAPMDVTDYVAGARAAVTQILARGRQVLVTGGSGFYLKAFFAPIADDVQVSAELRAQIRLRLATEGLPALVAELSRLNPAGTGPLDLKNPRRVVRALERCLASGRTLADLRGRFAAQPAPFADCEIRLCELVRAKPELDRRIDERVSAMLRAGLVEEVRRLVAQGLKQNPSAARAIGYRETIDYLEAQAGHLASSRRVPPTDGRKAQAGPGLRTEADLAGAIAQNTRALVKKQRTWFKTQLPAHRQLDAGRASIDELFA